VTVTVTLDRKLDFRAAPALAEALLAAQGQDLELDAAELAQIGTQSLQIILAAAKSAVRDQRSVKLVNVSPPVAAQLQMLGFQLADVEAGGDALARAWE
jgi:anti-anti-sigma regulatory factor